MTGFDPRPDVAAYYAGRLREHGATPRGVDWNSADSQRARFAQLARVWDGAPGGAVIGDYGCGYGAFYDYLRERGGAFAFRGYDIAPEMVGEAARRHPDDPRAVFSTDPGVLAECDYVVASGVFNVKLAAPADGWAGYVLRTIDELAGLARRGFAFNALTSYSDPDRMRPDLYYPDPCRLFDHCKRRHSRHVALLHDYGLYEFTVLVRYEPAAGGKERP
jgi:hypothetical protein